MTWINNGLAALAWTVLLPLMLCTLPLLNGCTVLGLSLGAFVDHRSARFEDVPPTIGLRELDDGDSVICIMRNTGVIAGSYVAMGESNREPPLDRPTSFRVITKDQRMDIDTSEVLYMRFVRTAWTATALLGLLGIASDVAIILGFMYQFQWGPTI